MKRAVLLALPLLLAATPAFATSGFECRPTSGEGPRLILTIGHGVGPAIVAASLSESSDNPNLTTSGEAAEMAVGQGWIDEQRLWLDLTDRNVMRYEARLRVEFQPRGRPAIGTLQRGGRTYQVRCIEG